MVAAMGPEYQKYIWWKKYLTTMQMVSLLNDNWSIYRLYFYCFVLIVTTFF